MNTQEVFYEVSPHLIESSVDGEGRIEFSGRRFVFFRTSMFAKLFQSMEEQAGPVINRKINEFGVESGIEIGQKMDEDFSGFSLIRSLKAFYYTGFNISKLKKLADTSSEAQFRKILGYGKHVGWFDGIKVNEFTEDSVEVSTANTFESESYGETGNKECDFVTGVLEGLMVHFWDDEDVEGEEVRCQSEGHERCVMRVERDV